MRFKDLILESSVDELESEIIDMLAALHAEGITEINTQNLLNDLTNEFNPIDEERLVELLNNLPIVSDADENSITLADISDISNDDFDIPEPPDGEEGEIPDEDDMEGPPIPGEEEGIPGDEEIPSEQMPPDMEDDEDIENRIDSLRGPASRVDTLARKKSWGDI